MTGQQVAYSKPRLARKGLAVPAGLADQPALAESNGASPAYPRAGADAEADMDREASTETSAPIANPEAAPVASLLPFDFLRERAPSFDPTRLPRAEPEVTPEPAAEPLAESLAEPPAESLAEPPAEAAADPKPETAPAITATPAKAEAPRVDPSWRIGHDPKPARSERGRARPALAAALAVAAVLGLGWHSHQAGWIDFGTPTPERTEAPSETPTLETPALGTPTQETPGQEAPGAVPPVAEKRVPEEAVGTAVTPAPASTLTPALPPAAAPAEEDKAADVGQTLEATPPSIDVVRVETDGAAVIAGRAAPRAELIVLDNGAPIGTATADAFGEWVFIPDAPLPAGAHEFGLVIKRIQGGASLPAAGETREPGPAGPSPAGDAPAREEAERSPTGSEREPAAQRNGGGVPLDNSSVEFPSADFVVQLASVKTRAGAQREWRTLRRRFPKLLGDMRLNLDEAKLAGGASVVRLRIGAFADVRAAAALCKRLAAKRQGCLVVRTAADG